jgi:cation transport regulator ChaB
MTMRAKKEMPKTLRRSPEKAQRTWAKTHDSAVRTYGEGERAHRTAYSSLKHSFEKVGDQWEPKGHKGPSDPRAKKPTREARAGKGETLSSSAAPEGTSKMTKKDLARAIAKKQK